MRESDLSAKIAKYLRFRGHLVVKLSTMRHYGTRGYPDLLVLPQGGGSWFIEVKMPGRLLTPHQDRMITKLRVQGYVVHTVHSLDELKEVVG